MHKSLTLFESFLKNQGQTFSNINLLGDPTIKGEFDIQQLTKTMRKIRLECQKQFPEFTDLGYKLREAKYIHSLDLAIFICGIGTIGKVSLINNSIQTKSISETRLMKLTLDYQSETIYFTGRNQYKELENQYVIVEFSLSAFTLKRIWTTNEVIIDIFFCEEEKKIYLLTERGVFLAQVNDMEAILFEEIILGDFVCFKYSLGEWLLGGKNNEITRVNKEGEKFVVDTKGSIIAAKYSRSGKLVLALVEKQVILYDLMLKHKKTVNLKDKPIGAIMNDDDKQIILSTVKGEIIIINIYSEQVLYIPVHRDEIVHFWMNQENKQIFTFGKDSKMSKFEFPSIIDSRSEGFYSLNFVFCGTNPDLVYIESKTRIKRWNFIFGGSDVIYDSKSELSKSLSYSDVKNLLLFCELEQIILMNPTSKEIVRKIELPSKINLNHCKFTENGDYFFTLAAQNNFIYCYHTTDSIVPYRLKGHEGKVNCQTTIKRENLLVTGGNDCRIIVWDYVKEKKYLVFEGHKAAVTCICTTREANKIISGSKDCTIKVWDWRNKQLIITLNSHNNPIVKVKTDNMNQMLSVSSEGTMIYWNLRAYVKIFKYNLNSDITDFNLSDNYKWAAYTDLSGLKVIYFPTYINLFDVIGPNNQEKYEYIYYLYKILKGEDVDYDQRWDDWAVLPYQYNTLLFYSFSNMYKHLKLSIQSGSLLIPSPNADPYSIVSVKNYERCLKVFFESSKTILDSNLHSLTFINQNVIVYLNKLGHSHLHVFYKSIFRKYPNTNFPKFIDKKLLPRVIYSKSLHPQHSNFFSAEELNDMEGVDDLIEEKNLERTQSGFKNINSSEIVPVLLYTSAIRMNFIDGSQESIDFITSLLNCGNKEIFKTKYIQTILNQKWKKLRVYQLFQLMVYGMYLISMSVFLIFFYKNLIAYSLLLGIAGLLFIYDIVQICSNFTLFWKDIWNYFDLSRTLLYIIYSISFFFDVWVNISNELMTAICFISLVRGIAFFRVFDDTRYFIQLIISVIYDIKSFAIILTYSTASFSLVRMIQDDSKSFFHHFQDSLMVNLGNIEINTEDPLSWILIVLMGTINIIILLNMLIAIMGETFNKVRENSSIANYMEIAQMVIEIETVYVAKNSNIKKTHLQLCEADFSDDLGESEEIKDLIKIKRYLKILATERIKNSK